MIHVYGYKKCSTVNKALKFLNNNSLAFEFTDFVVNNLSKEKLKELLIKGNLDIDAIFNSKGQVFKKLDLGNKLNSMNEEEKLELLSSNGMLIKRPLIEGDNFVLVGFKEQDLSSKLNL